MEERLREEASLARLGEMAAVVAHEVKNPLAGIRGAIEVIAKRLPDESRHRPIIAEILARIDGLNEMMQDLLLFARPPAPRFQPTEVIPLLASTADLLAQDPALRTVSVRVTGSAPVVLADSQMLKIAFQNLFINGAHAMDGRGTIRVAVSASGSVCHVDIADEGPGIPIEARDKIFTPFFTTKSRGSGLGLPTVKRLIDAHQGRISIDCPPAGGTVVRVSLPIASA
jgi:signal transduction histidine kinase